MSDCTISVRVPISTYYGPEKLAYFRIVRGWPITLRGRRFVVHLSIENAADKWTVAGWPSGMRVAGGQSRQQAIQRALRDLPKIPEHIDQGFATAEQELDVMTRRRVPSDAWRADKLLLTDPVLAALWRRMR